VSPDRVRRDRFDVAIVGGGVVGAAVARRLARTTSSVALLEAGADVGAGTSKANTAVLHTGFDTKPGSLESVLVPEGHALLSEYATRAGIPVERTGALLVAWTDEEADALPDIAERAAIVGYDRCEIVDAAECARREPGLGPGARRGLLVPDEHIVCPFTPPLAFATEAVANGATLLRGEALLEAQRAGDAWDLLTTTRRIGADWVVNAAGLHADEVEAILGHPPDFVVVPRRGQLVVFDKLARPLVHGIVLPVPTGRTKGVLVAPTVFGNVMVGPTAEDLDDKTDTASTADGLARLLGAASRVIPALADEEVTAVYAGLRAATDDPDYRLAARPDDHTLCLGGIRSTGLTASMALAEWATARLGEAGVDVRERDDAVGVRMPNLGEASLRPYQDAARIAADPAYGAIVCHCERVTAGEIRDACTSLVPPSDLDGVRRRTRALMGRCQGFACTGAVVAATAAATGVRAHDLLALADRHA